MCPPIFCLYGTEEKKEKQEDRSKLLKKTSKALTEPKLQSLDPSLGVFKLICIVTTSSCLSSISGSGKKKENVWSYFAYSRKDILFPPIIVSYKEWVRVA